ncbi:MAG: class I SAM-dependent methyltransferase [Ahrensia sp.]|nr:class I SAM-dependent methyltransferase [Ahrensia sp.]
MASAVDTLFIPYRNGAIPPIAMPWLFLGADVPLGGFASELKQHLKCVTGWRDQYLSLEAAGLSVAPSLSDDARAQSYGGAFVLLTKHKRENIDMILRANQLVEQGKPIVIAGDKNLGVASMRKWVGTHHPVVDAIAKNHATVFWFLAAPADASPPAEVSTSIQGFVTAPGMFSADKIDAGSAFLAAHITKDISGDIADFGAGWGYLSKVIIDNAKPRSLALLEAHWPSLEAAKQNLSDANVPINFRWIDIINEQVTQKYDWIIMNPPFHDGRKTDPHLGERFIEAASNCLKSGGRLLLVANSNLPYEAKLASLFKSVECVQIKNGFKVLKARRGVTGSQQVHGGTVTKLLQTCHTACINSA